MINERISIGRLSFSSARIVVLFETHCQEQFVGVARPVDFSESFLQGVSVAASPILAIVGKTSVRPSVRLSVTRWH